MFKTAAAFQFTRFFYMIALVAAGLVLTSDRAAAQVTAYKQAVAEAAARDDDLSAFYRANDYRGIWTNDSEADRTRRRALFEAFDLAEAHGLPRERYREPRS